MDFSPFMNILHILCHLNIFLSVCLLTLGVEENMQDVVGHITEGVCRPLKVSNQITFV